MKIKKYFSFIIITMLFLFSSVGNSDFIIGENIILDENQIDRTDDYYICLDYNDGTNKRYKYLIDDKAGRFDQNDNSFPEPVSLTNHEFNGWYETKSGFFDDGTSSLYDRGILDSGDILYAKYINTDEKALTNDLFSNYTITPSMTSNNKNYYFLSAYTRETLVQSYRVGKGGAFSVNFQDTGGSYSTSLEGNDKTIKYVSQAEIIVVLDSDLIIDGGTFQLSSILGGNSGELQAQITGKFTALDLNGYNIIIRNGGLLNAFGVIFNSSDTGGILVENGTVNTPFLVYGFKGGGMTGAAWGNAVAPFNNFLCPYLSVETIFTNASTLLGETSLFANGAKYSTTLKLIGNSSDSLIQITTGYIIKRTSDYKKYTQDYLFNYSIVNYYDALTSNYRETFIFTNNVSEHAKYVDNSLIIQFVTDKCVVTQNSLDLAVNVGVSLNVSMRYVDFPIPSFFDIYLYNTNLSFDISFQFMPGSYLYADENTSIYFKKQDSGNYDYNIFAKVITFERYPYSIQYKSASTSTTSYSFPLNSYPVLYVSQRLAFSAAPAKIKIDGNIYFEDYAKTSDDSYSYYSIGGRAEFSEQALNMIYSNSSKIKLANMGAQYFHHNYDGSSLFSNIYTLDLAEYATMPLISENNCAYFQTEQFGEIKKGNYLSKFHLIDYKGEYYFYNFDNQKKNLKSFKTLDLLSVTNSPTEANNEDKYNNLIGNFEKCTLTVLNEKANAFYITDQNKQNYVYMHGGFLPIEEAPTYTKENKTISDVVLSAENKFSSTTVSNITFGQTAYFDNVYLNEWRLNYAS